MPSVTNPVHSLVFGGITLVSSGSYPSDANGVKYIVRPTDTGWGNPNPITAAVLSLLRQGNLVAYDRTDNRTITLRVTVQANDSDKLALGERALQLECEKTNTLTWTPPDGVGQPTVFDIIWSQLELDFDDQDELLVRRTYKITMQALPYGRTASTIITSVVGATATETIIDSGSATTGWSTTTGTVTTASGFVVNTATINGTTPNPVAVDLIRTATFSNSDPLLAVTWTSTTFVGPLVAVATGNIGTVTLFTASTVNNGSTFTTWFRIPTALTSITQLKFSLTKVTRTKSGTFSIDKVSTWTALPSLGTARQKIGTITPGGSVKTQGSLEITHASSSLGTTIVYTCPSANGYVPAMRQYLAFSGATTADASTVSGSYNSPGTTMTYKIPVANVPRGRVELWALIQDSLTFGSPRQFTISFSAYPGSTGLSTYGTPTILTDITPTSTGVYQMFNLASVVLPPIEVGPAGYVGFSIGSGTASGIRVDECFLFGTDVGRLTVVDCGTAAPSSTGGSNRLWIDAPSPDVPMGAIYRGFDDGRADAYHAGPNAQVWDVHEFEPTGSSIFVVTTNALDASTSLTHYRRYQTHVANGV